MTHFFGILAALVLIYVATSMIVVGKLPSQAVGLLGLIIITPSLLLVLDNTPGFAAGFMYMLLLVALTGFSFRLLLGKRLFSVLVASPLNNLARAWFNGKGRKSIKDIWGAKGRK